MVCIAYNVNTSLTYNSLYVNISSPELVDNLPVWVYNRDRDKHSRVLHVYYNNKVVYENDEKDYC